MAGNQNQAVVPPFNATSARDIVFNFRQVTVLAVQSVRPYGWLGRNLRAGLGLRYRDNFNLFSGSEPRLGAKTQIPSSMLQLAIALWHTYVHYGRIERRPRNTGVNIPDVNVTVALILNPSIPSLETRIHKKPDLREYVSSNPLPSTVFT